MQLLSERPRVRIAPGTPIPRKHCVFGGFFSVIKKDLSLDDVGRKGERLTLQYEELRTNVKPDWRSIETNLSGYDVLSQRSKTDNTPLLSKAFEHYFS